MNSKDYINNDTFWEWIDKHINEDVFRLRLSVHGDVMLEDACTQIECRKKTAKKLPETLANARFYFPNTLSAEQSTSDDLAEFHATLVDKDARVLDMTSGLGIDVMHISRKAQLVDACDIKPELVDSLKFNCRNANISNVRCINTDSIDYISNCSADSYDVVFIDPARRSASGGRLFALSDCTPDVVSALPRIMSVSPRLIVKASPMIDISRVIEELPCVVEVISTGTATECKEIVAVCQRENEEPLISAFTAGYGIFSFRNDEEKTAEAVYSLPVVGHYLFEPYPAVMKAAPFKLLCNRFGLGKISASTHLYVSDKIVDGFPGKCYEIVDVADFDKKGMKRISSSYPSLNISTRNFPLSPEKLAAKLKIKTGGELKMFAVTDSDSRRILIIARRITD